MLRGRFSARLYAYPFVEIKELGGKQAAQQHGGHLSSLLRLLAILDVAQEMRHLQLS